MALVVEGWWQEEAAVHEEEQEWLPNPYQAQADAQVLSGAWPGTPILIGCGVPELETPQDMACSWAMAGVSPSSWQPLEAYPCDAGLALTAENGDGSPISWQPLDAMQLQHLDALQCNDFGFAMTEYASDYPCWDASSWHPAIQHADLMEFVLPEGKITDGSFSTTASTEEGDFDAETAESTAASGGEANLADSAESTESTDGDEVREQESDLGGKGRYSRKLSHQCVPKRTDLGKCFGEDVEKEAITTLMVRNVPNMYNRSMLIEELNSLGFEGEFDFIYLPMDKATQWNVGYAFVNFASPSVAKRAINKLTNYAFQCYDHGSGKVAQISIAHIQGLERNLEYYSNTAVQCARIQTYRPLVVSSKGETWEVPERGDRRPRRSWGRRRG